MVKRFPSHRGCAYGDLSGGKSLTCIFKMLKFRLDYPKLPIFSNIALKKIEYRAIDNAAVLFDIDEPCFLLLDELWHMADSRKGMSVMNDVLNMLLLRSARKGWTVWYTLQWYTQVDLRIRFVTQYWIEPLMYYNKYLRNDVFDKNGKFLQTDFVRAEPLYKYFDSTADPLTLNIRELKILYHRWREKMGFE